METERINRIRRFGADMVCGADRKGSVSQGSVTIKEQIRLLFTGGGIFLSGFAEQEASGVRPMWKTG